MQLIATAKKTDTHSLVSDSTLQLLKSVEKLSRNSGEGETTTRIETLAEQLFKSTADAKVTFSKVSVHFPKELRDKLFSQLDLIHDASDWETDDQPIVAKSLTSFLRWTYVTKPQKNPNFGLSNDGYLVASWLGNSNKDKLILEFLVNDRIRWFVEKRFEETTDYSNGITKLTRINKVLEPYEVEQWFS